MSRELELEFPEVCDFLKQVKKAEQRVEHLEQRIENLRLLTTDTSVHLSDIPHSPSPDQQKLLTLLANIDELERELKQAKQEALERRLLVGNIICQISDPISQKILILHYLNHRSYSAISKTIGCGLTYIYRLRDVGYAELEELLHTA